jgi:hypothetical protein
VVDLGPLRGKCGISRVVSVSGGRWKEERLIDRRLKTETLTFAVIIYILGILALVSLTIQLFSDTCRSDVEAASSHQTGDRLLRPIESASSLHHQVPGIGSVMALTFGYDDGVAPENNLIPSNSPPQPAPPLGLFGQSEYMIGSVAVAVIFPESDGSHESQTENWSPTRSTACVNEITSGLTWWQNQEPRANLSFQVHSYGARNTGYEPITRPSTDEGLWISEILTGMGYTGLTYFDQVTALNNYEMSQYGTDWAFSIFVVDDLNDVDNKFSNNLCAYAYVGGPFFVMTYDNDVWTNSNMDLVTSHETGHIFWATDEYDGSTVYSGYLNVSDNESATCVMDSNVQVVCAATRGQLGWRDSDSDNILDPVDTVPDTSFATSTVSFTNIVTPAFTGTAIEVPLANLNPQWWSTGNDISINTVTSVQYRVDGGSWDNATAMDGTFDSQTETFTFATPALSAGSHVIELRAGNSAGNWESSFAVHSVVLDLTLPTASINTQPGFVNSLAAISGTASDDLPGELQEVQVQIRNVSAGYYWNGIGWSSSEAWQVASGTVNWDYALPSLQDGITYEVKARAHDKAGNVSSAATQSFVFDTSHPTVTIEDVPPFVNSLTVVSGSAGDTSPGVVDKVQVQLANLDEETYWSGSDWTSNAVWLDASGVEPWAYDLPAMENGTTYIFQARAIDGAVNESSLVSERFVVDTEQPGVALDPMPAYLNQVYSLEGTAWDIAPGELETVWLQIQRVSGSACWNGSSWSSEAFWLDLGDDSPWSYSMPALSTGAEYEVSVKTVDKAGNEGVVRNTFWFDTDSPTLDMEAIPERIPELPEIRGTTADVSGSGVDRVIVLVQDESNRTYWTGESWLSQQCWIKAQGTDCWKYALPPLVEGSTYELQVKAIDRAGNESMVSTYTFAIETSSSLLMWVVIGVVAVIGLAALVLYLRWRSARG